MSNKRHRNTEKRAAREAALAPKVLMPKPTMIDHLKPAFPQRLEAPIETQTQFYSAIERLKDGVGDAITFQLLFSRLMFGRILAHNYFGDEPAEEVHYHLQQLVIAAHENMSENGSSKSEDYTDLKMDKKICNEIKECLVMIDEMCSKVTPNEYTLSGYKVEAELVKNKDKLTRCNLKTWEQYKEDEGL